MSISVHTLPLLARIETRPYADHFIARHLGLTASCTSSAKQSAEYIVEKLLKKFVHDGAFKNPVLLSLKAEAEGVFVAEIDEQKESSGLQSNSLQPKPLSL